MNEFIPRIRVTLIASEPMEEDTFDGILPIPMSNDNFSSNFSGDEFSATSALFNISTREDNATGGVRRHLAVSNQILITFFYIFGIGGNLATLIIISRKETQRYKKQTLMLKSLALNDLSALVGSFVLMHLSLYTDVARRSASEERWLCAMRVLCRAFGLGSGCVSFVMAVERWLALSHPFTYQKHITQAMIRTSILGLWSFNALLVCAPLAGLGLWYDEGRTEGGPCVRYRFATAPLDRAYAYFVFAFGMTMCVCIVWCNLSVMRVLCRLGQRSSSIGRRCSRASCRTNSTASLKAGAATEEELSFARLMAVLSIFFVICWAPQLLSIIAAQHSLIQRNSPLYRAADVLIALNFTLDPYVYVLFRRGQVCRSRGIRRRRSQSSGGGGGGAGGGVSRSPGRRKSSSSPRSPLIKPGSAEEYAGRKVSCESESRPTTSSTRLSRTTSEREREYVPLQLLLQ